MAYKRIIEVEIGPPGEKGIKIRDLYMTFSVELGNPGTLPPASVTIYNLAPEIDSEYIRADNELIIRAGYEDEGILPVFKGQIWGSTRKRQNADWMTTIRATCDSKFMLSGYTCSYDGHTQIKRVITDMLQRTGMPSAGTENIPEDVYYQNGFSFGPGTIRQFLHTVVVCRLGWLQPQAYNGTLYFVAPGVMPKVTVPSLSAETGLLLEPERQIDKSQNMAEQQHAAPGSIITRYKLTTMLMPQIQPATAVLIKSKTFTGTQWVETVTHRGDNRGGEFRSEAIVSNIMIPVVRATA